MIFEDRQKIPGLDAAVLARVADEDQSGTLALHERAQFRTLPRARDAGLVHDHGRTEQTRPVHCLAVLEKIRERDGGQKTFATQHGCGGSGRRARDDFAARRDEAALHFLQGERFSCAGDAPQRAHAVGRFEQ